MNWFSANVFFISRHSQGSSNHNLWEERIFIVRAACESDAMESARQIGIENQLSYAVSENDQVTWEFDRVDRVFEIPEGKIDHGTEIFSRFLKDSEVASLLTPFDD